MKKLGLFFVMMAATTTIIINASEASGTQSQTIDFEAIAKEVEAWRLSAPLVTAAADGDVKMVNELLAKGTDINQRGAYETTALIEAVSYGNIPVVELLLAKKADVNLKNDVGYTALDTAQLSKIMGKKMLSQIKKAPIAQLSSQELQEIKVMKKGIKVSQDTTDKIITMLKKAGAKENPEVIAQIKSSAERMFSQ